MNNSKLSRVWEVNEPYSEVLEGILSEDVFAASLGKVRAGIAESIYQNPDEFFDKTYVTDALKTLIQNILQKLNDTHPEYNSIYKLETSFGGGKTHTLIALFHALKNPQINSKTYKDITNSLEIPTNVKVIALDGDEYNPQNGDEREEGIFVKTLWGDLAYQLGGKDAYEIIRKNDENLSSPGSKTLERLMGSEPVLILIDEPAVYFSRAESVIVGGTTLTKQTITFLHDLMSSVSRKSNAVVVITLASSSDAFSEFNSSVNTAITQAESVVARKAEIIYPTNINEMYGVVRRRLFKSWDEKMGETVANTFYKMYSNITELNSKYKSNEYLERMSLSYPFHPELLDILETRLSSISTFQRTRGALRLLARVIADMWHRKEDDAYLISPAQLALDNTEIRNELTGKIGQNALIPAIQADIANENEDAKSQLMNQEYIDKGLPPLVSRVANTVYLYSLISGGKEKTGIDQNTLIGGIITPGIKYDVYSNIISKMDEFFWFFHQTNGRLYFYSEPTINKIIQDYMNQIEANKIRERLHNTLEHIFTGQSFTLISQPSGPSDVPDDEKLKLIIIDYKTVALDSKADPIPNIVEQIWNYGKDEKPRLYKNTTFFILADRNNVSRMNDVTKEYEAYQLMNQHKEDLTSLSQEQRDKLEGNMKKVEQELVIAVAKVYRYLFYPKVSTLDVAELDPSAIGEMKKSRQEIIKDLLKSESKIKDKITAAYMKSKAWPTHQKEVSTQEVKDWFYQKFTLPIPAKLDTIKDMIQDGLAETKDKKALWVYQSGSKIYLPGDKIPQIKFSADEKLVLLEEAISRDWCNPDGQRCEKCNKWPCECVEEPPKSEEGESGNEREGEEQPEKEKKSLPKKKPYNFESDKGLPEVIIQQFEEDYETKKPDTFQELQLICDTPTAAKSLITLFVHLPKSPEISIEMTIERTEETPESITKIKLDFAGNPDDFRELYNGLHSFISNKKIQPKITLIIGFENEVKETIDKFFSYLKNYNSVEYKVHISGIIQPKVV